MQSAKIAIKYRDLYKCRDINTMAENSRVKTVLKIQEKINICKEIEAGKKRDTILKDYNISRWTLRRILLNKDKYITFYENFKGRSKDNRRTMMVGRHEKLEQELYKWFVSERASGMPISGPLLTEKAKQLSVELNISDSIMFTNGWLNRFKERFNLRQLKLSGEALSADHEAAQTYIHTFAKIIQDNNLSPEQVCTKYN